VLPRGEATNGLQVGTLLTQTDVKSRWPGGSIKSAIVSAKIPADGHYAITAADGPTATAFRPTQWPSVIVQFTTKDAEGNDVATYEADLPSAPTLADRWLTGPLVAEARWTEVPVINGTNTGSHPSLRVLFDVRSYGPVGSGQHWVDVTVENVVDTAAGDSVTYDVRIVVNGAESRKPDVVHDYLARWRQTFPVNPGQGALEISRVTPDFGPFVRAGAIPNYLPTITDQAYSTVGPEFDILQFGSLHLPMNDHGGRPEIAPYPDWAAKAIVYRFEDQLDFVIKHGELAGSFATHFKEAQVDTTTGHDWFTIDKHPGFWLDSRADPNISEQPSRHPLNADLSGMAEPGDIAHQPSLAYLPYLITGQRFFLDELTHWANYTLLATHQEVDTNLRGGGYIDAGKTMPRYPGSRGLIVFNEVRGIGWGLRNIADAAFILPDAHPLKSYFADKVSNNLLWLDDYARTFNSGPVASMFPFRRFIEDGQYPPYGFIALWEQRYVGWAVDRARRILELPDGIDFLTRLANFEVKLFTSEEFDREWAGVYVLAVGEKTAAFEMKYFQTLKEVFVASSTAGVDPSPDPTDPTEPTDPNAPAPLPPIGDFYRPFEGFYGPEARLMLMVARGLGVPRAEEAYEFLMSHRDTVWPNGQRGSGKSMFEDLNNRSGWAIGLGGVNPLSTDVAPTTPTPRTNAVSPNPIQ
jgi:hypothetical protein